jgi:glutamate/tyrosine decarboxylase-like PLP-dependent enzyme
MALSEAEAAALDAAAAHAKAYRQGVDRAPVRPELGYPETMARFAEPVPERGMPAAAVVEELVRKAEGGLNGMTSPTFHGWVIGASHPAGVAADWLTSAWGQAGGFADPTPAAAVAEEVAVGWVLDLLGLPRDAGVGVTTGATMANFTALAAARGALLRGVGWDVEALRQHLRRDAPHHRRRADRRGSPGDYLEPRSRDAAACLRQDFGRHLPRHDHS